MANRTAQMKGGQSYLDSPKGAGQKKKATQGESKVSTRKPIYLFPQKKKNHNIFFCIFLFCRSSGLPPHQTSPHVSEPFFYFFLCGFFPVLCRAKPLHKKQHT